MCEDLHSFLFHGIVHEPPTNLTQTCSIWDF